MSKWVREAGGSLSIIDEQGRMIAELAPKYWNGHAVVEWSAEEIAAHAERITAAAPRVPSIRKAYEVVRDLAPDDQAICITVECWWFVIGGVRQPMESKFSIYDGSGDNHQGKSLDAAIQTFVAAHQPPALEEEIDAIIAEVSEPIHPKE